MGFERIPPISVFFVCESGKTSFYVLAKLNGVGTKMFLFSLQNNYTVQAFELPC